MDNQNKRRKKQNKKKLIGRTLADVYSFNYCMVY